MKKLSLALACVIGMMFFASCDPNAINDILEQKPTVEFVSGDNLVSDFSGFWVNTELHFQFKLAPNATSKSPITSFHFAIHDMNGQLIMSDEDATKITNPDGETIIEEVFVKDVPSTYTVKVSVKDAAGKESTAGFAVDYVLPIVSVLGTYQGNVVLAGHVKTDKAVAGYSLDDDYTTGNLPTTVVLGELGENNRVSATFEIDGRPVTLYCTKNDNTLNIDEFHFDRSVPVEGSNASVLLDIKIKNGTAVLSEGTMTLTGNVEGTGTVTGIQYLNVTATATGTINGELQEQPTGGEE